MLWRVERDTNCGLLSNGRREIRENDSVVVRNLTQWPSELIGLILNRQVRELERKPSELIIIIRPYKISL